MAASAHTSIDGGRLLGGLATLRAFGGHGNGVIRQMFSTADMDARRWLRDQMAEAGLNATIDGVGNVVGRSKNNGPSLLIGSHSDTQPEGGWLDGAMGVMYAIEIARALHDNSATAHLPVDVVAWADEEGAYCSFLGSRSYVGELPSDYLTTTGPGGETVGEAIDRLGLASMPRAEFNAGDHIGYLEAHIEQGPHLEETDLLIGVVTSIVGIHGFDITFTGEQNHAGTTPMHRRKDAGVVMFDFAVELRKRLAAVASPTSVWTIGDVRLEPGAQSIVPGIARLTLQMRDASDKILAGMDDVVAGLAVEMHLAQPHLVEIDAVSLGEVVATNMNDGLRQHIQNAATIRTPDGWVDMPSAAGHDSMVLARHMPCAMLFIPSIGGISHDFAEDSHPEHIVLGCQVLADAAVSILSNQNNKMPRRTL